ncbi:AAA family ATPase [Dulcicalothrix desertica]|nr:ATP-binding protein [Dulcicalothrix desertica]TWH50292.1 AAA15 family ATPase/GTPase [Dulcicalothrix desertica PCC 7102]
MLNDLTVQNYRCFKDLHINDFARVNLLVGMNNSGKTSLLEAIYLLVNQDDVHRSLIELLQNRVETDKLPVLSGDGNQYQLSQYLSEEVRNLFYGFESNDNQDILIKSSNQDLSFSIRKISHKNIFNQNSFEIICSDGSNSPIKINLLADGTVVKQDNLPILPKKPSLLLASSNLNFQKLSELWNSILLTPKENKVVSALQILEPAVRRVGFTSYPNYHSSILLKLDTYPQPIPLISMGEGMRRILAIAMASVTVENGFLLIDEIETGLHYEAQSQMWHFLLEIAKELNIQIFATTHSWDCIASFQEALAPLEDSSIGKLFRLSRQEENIRVVEYNSKELSIAVRQSIEVR